MHNNLNNAGISHTIDIESIRYYYPEKVNSFFVGVEKYNYLMLSVIQNNFELYKFLLIEKNAKPQYINENGWSVLNFIIDKKLWIFFSFLFGLPNPEQCDSTEKIYNELNKIKIYNKNAIKNNKNELTYTGAALSVIDKMTKNNNNLLSLCIDELNDIFFLKSLIILYENYINYFIINQKKDLLNNKEKYKIEQDKIYFSFISNVFNNQYGKNKETLLIKSIKKSNFEMFQFLLNDIYFNGKKIDLDIYKTDFHGQNLLHYSVQLKQKETILYLVKHDADSNKLLNGKDIKGKVPSDFDKIKSFENELCTVWNAAKNNDINMLDILINKLEYYTINEQTNIKGNTPLHLAVQNKADKAVLFLILNGADKNIKNNKKFTPLESIKDDKNIDKKWKAKVKKILNGKIKDYTELDSCNFDKILKNEENIKLTEKINLMNGNIKKEYNKKEENKKKGNKKENKKEIKKIKKEMDKLTFGISTNSKLRELFFDISNNIKIQNINLDKLIEKYDKTNSGVINNDDFNDLIKNLNIENIDLTDIDFLKSFLKRDKDENILYKDFIDLVKN